MSKLLKTLIAIALLNLSHLVAEDTAFDSSIPVLDMEEYYNPETKTLFIQKLSSALKDVGFFALTNTGVDSKILDRAYDAAEEFFRADSDLKMKYYDVNVNGQRGYVPGESAKGQKLGDFKEFYHIGRELDQEQIGCLGYCKNIWPQESNLKEPLYTLFRALEAHSNSLEEAIGECIGKPANFFSDMTKEGDVLLRAIHYPVDPPENRFWAAEHTDIDLLSILPRATADGLQVKNKDGNWIDVKVPENAFIINAGDMLENITNGEFRSGPHRVVDKGEHKERFSMVLFVHPRSNDAMDPLPECIQRTGGKKKYATATRWELLEERLVDLGLASPAMQQHLASCGLMERLIDVGRASPKAMRKLKEAGLASEAVLKELERLEN